MASTISLKKFAYVLISFAVFFTSGFFYLRSSSTVSRLEHDIAISTEISQSDFGSALHLLSTNPIVLKDANLDSSVKSSAYTANSKQSGSWQKTERISEDEFASKYYFRNEKASKNHPWSAFRLENGLESSIGNAREILEPVDVPKTKSKGHQNLVLHPGMKRLAKDSRSFKFVSHVKTDSKALKKKPSRARRKMRHRPYHGPQLEHPHTLSGRSESEKKKAGKSHVEKNGNPDERKVDLLGMIPKKTSVVLRHPRADDLRTKVAIRQRLELSTKRGQLHYELSNNWPQTCECKLARGLEKGTCYYYLDESMTSCKRRLCAWSFLCVVSGEKTGTTCFRKKVTRRVISNGGGTCRTAVVDQYKYIPYSS